MSDSSALDVSAVILAGGKGTRLKPLTAVFPKPLVPLGDKPVLEILLRRLSAFGLHDVTICTGYLAELLMAVVRDGSQFGLKVRYSREEETLGTAGPLTLIDDLSSPCIVMNGDLLTTLNFANMIDYHVGQGADVTVAAYKRDVRIDFGVIESDDQGGYTGFREKPTYHFEVSMGVNVLSRSARELLQPGEYCDMPDLIAKVHDGGGKVCCYREKCYWLDIGRMDDYALAQEQYLENESRFLGVDP
jgi:NDP-sugar pyrophosphorylase family protein